MKILVTGATGFLGSHLVRALIGAGAEVLILKRSFSDTTRIDDLLPSLVAYDSDCCDLDSLFRSQGDIDIILHAATCYGRNGESLSEVAEANTSFPLRLLERAAAAGVSTFIHVDTGLERFLNGYALSKKHFSEWGRLAAQQGRISYVNVILEHFYGPGDDASKFVTYVIKNCLNHVPQLDLTRGEQVRDFIYIDDVVSALLLTVQNSSSAPRAFYEFGLGSGVGVRVRDLVETIHQLTGSSSTLNFGALPYRANEIMLSVADTRYLHDLGWSPQVALAEGLARTITLERRSVAGR